MTKHKESKKETRVNATIIFNILKWKSCNFDISNLYQNFFSFICKWSNYYTITQIQYKNTINMRYICYMLVLFFIGCSAVDNDRSCQSSSAKKGQIRYKYNIVDFKKAIFSGKSAIASTDWWQALNGMPTAFRSTCNKQ